jgi:hypothetical protein
VTTREMTMRWFGHRYDAPAWDGALQVPVPVGEPCLGCTELIAADDDGITLPQWGTEERHPYHLRCFFDSILGAGHPMPPDWPTPASACTVISQG